MSTVNKSPKLPAVPLMYKRSKNIILPDEETDKIENLRKSDLIVDGSPGKVSHHAACLVFYTNKLMNRSVSLYNSDTSKIVPPRIMQYEGIYCFGGKDQDGHAKRELYILVIGNNPWNWINLQKYIDKHSPSPPARYGHWMHYCNDLDFVVLFGGRNDSVGKINDWILNDLWMLSLNTLEWK